MGSLTGIEVGLLWGPLPALLAAVMLMVVVLGRVAPGRIPREWHPALMLRSLGAAVGTIVILEAFIGESPASFGSLVTVEVHRAFGLYVAVLAGLALAVGGFLYRNERR